LGLLQFTHSLKAAFAIWCFDLTTEFQPGMLNLPSETEIPYICKL